MPYEQVLAHLWLGRIHQELSDSHSRDTAGWHLRRAEQLMTEFGYGLELPALRQLLQNEKPVDAKADMLF